MSLFAGTELYQPPKCDRCGALESDCQCPEIIEIPEVLPPEKQTVKLAVEKRKKGKLVTVVRGLAEGTPEPHLSQLLKQLKNKCGAGGSVQAGNLEIQGDHLETLTDELKQRGYRLK